MTPRPARLVAAILVVVAFQSLTPRASAEFIDGFDVPNPGRIYQIALLDGNPYNSPTDVVSPGVTRDIRVEVSSPVPPNFNSASGTIGGGTFTMDTDNASAATSTIRFTLTGAASNLSGATGVNLAFLNLDTGNGNVTPVPISVSIATATGTLTRDSAISGSTAPFTASFAIGSFSGSGDLSQVNSITIVLNGTNSQKAVDFALDEVSLTPTVVPPIPAPPGLLLAGVGVLALVGRARWTRKPTATA